MNQGPGMQQGFGGFGQLRQPMPGAPQMPPWGGDRAWAGGSPGFYGRPGGGNRMWAGGSPNFNERGWGGPPWVGGPPMAPPGQDPNLTGGPMPTSGAGGVINPNTGRPLIAPGAGGQTYGGNMGLPGGPGALPPGGGDYVSQFMQDPLRAYAQSYRPGGTAAFQQNQNALAQAMGGQDQLNQFMNTAWRNPLFNQYRRGG